MGADMVGYLLEIPIKLPRSVLKRAVKVVTTVHHMQEPTGPLPTFREAEELVRNLMDQWYPRGRDLAERTSPCRSKTHRLVFCGDMSWGDAPTGEAYQYFDELSERGLFDAFGIR